MFNVSKNFLNSLKKLRPISLALVGSSGGGERTAKSDVEIAIIFSQENYRTRSWLKKYSKENARVYPFLVSDLHTLKAVVPFPKSFYFWWVKNNSRTIWGEKILENLKVTPSKEDLREVIVFERGVALSALLSFRNNDKETAEWGFGKSCLFATAAALMLKHRRGKNFKEVVQKGRKVFPQFSKLIQKAERVRRGKTTIEERDIFDNIEYLFMLETSIR